MIYYAKYTLTLIQIDDEEGLQTTFQLLIKILTQRVRSKAIVSAESRTNVTAVIYANGTGFLIPPMQIVPRKHLVPELADGPLVVVQETCLKK